MKTLEVEVGFKLNEINAFQHSSFDIKVKVKVPGQFFKVRLEENLFTCSSEDKKNEFVRRCAKFMGDKQRVRSYVTSMIDECIDKTKMRESNNDEFEALRKMVKDKKITFTYEADVD